MDDIFSDILVPGKTLIRTHLEELLKQIEFIAPHNDVPQRYVINERYYRRLNGKIILQLGFPQIDRQIVLQALQPLVPRGYVLKLETFRDLLRDRFRMGIYLFNGSGWSSDGDPSEVSTRNRKRRADEPNESLASKEMRNLEVLDRAVPLQHALQVVSNEDTLNEMPQNEFIDDSFIGGVFDLDINTGPPDSLLMACAAVERENVANLRCRSNARFRCLLCSRVFCGIHCVNHTD